MPPLVSSYAAWLGLVALGCLAPATLGALLWRRYRIARTLMEMVVTRIYQYPPLLPAAPDAASFANEHALERQEIDAVVGTPVCEPSIGSISEAHKHTLIGGGVWCVALVAFECRVATAFAGQPVEVDEASSLFLVPANRLVFFEPTGPARRPPASIVTALEKVCVRPYTHLPRIVTLAQLTQPRFPFPFPAVSPLRRCRSTSCCSACTSAATRRT